jgi:hypothetical protein
MNRTEPIQSPQKNHPELAARDVELLSAYLDQELNERERTKLEARLKSQPELQAGLEELRHTRLMLRSLPRRKAPRNFTLRPEMVPARRRLPVLFPVFRLSSAMAGLLLVLALVGQAVISRTGLPASPALQNAAPLAAPAANGLSGQAKANDSAGALPFGSAPPMISWGTPTPPGGFVMGMGSANGIGGGGGIGGGPGGSGGGGPDTTGPNLATGIGGGDGTLAPTQDTANPPSLAAQPAVAPTATPEPPLAKAPLAPEATQAEPGTQERSIPNSPAADQAHSNNPILGVRPPGEAGAIEATPGTDVYSTEAATQTPGGEASPLNILRIIQGALAVIFVGSGGAAIFFYRKEKR